MIVVFIHFKIFTRSSRHGGEDSIYSRFKKDLQIDAAIKPDLIYFNLIYLFIYDPEPIKHK